MSVEFLVNQLKVTVPKGDWNAQGVDRATELARMLIREGVTDLAQLEVQNIVWYRDPSHCIVNESGEQCFEFPLEKHDGLRIWDKKNKRHFGFIGTPDRHDSTEHLEETRHGLMIAWSAMGHGVVGYHVFPLANTAGKFVILPIWDSSHAMGEIREIIRGIAPIVLGVIFPALGYAAGSAVGTAVTGSAFAAAYPAISTAIGNALISAVAYGGDIESIARGIAGSYIGSVAGSYANALTNSTLVSTVAQNVVSAAVKGSDLETAAKSALIRFGLSNMDQLILDPVSLPPEGVDSFDPTIYNLRPEYFGPLEDEIIDDFYPIPEFDNSLPHAYGDDGMTFDEIGTFPILVQDVEPDFLPPYQYELPSIDPVPIPTVPSSSGGDISNISNVMMAALNLVQAYQRTKQIQNAPAVVTNNGVRRVNPNGTISTTAVNGRVTTTLPPVGVAQVATDGSMVVNNGNGTFTHIDQNGQRTTRNYSNGVTTTSSPTTGGNGILSGETMGIPNAALIFGGLGIAAVILMSKKRKGR